MANKILIKKTIKVFLTSTLIIGSMGGCGGSKIQARLWEKDGAMRISEPDSTSHDYKFYIKTASDFGVDSRRREDRLILIQSRLDGTCKSIELVDELFLPTETKVSGDSLGTYVMRIRCIKN